MFPKSNKWAGWLFFSGRRWSDDTESRVTVIRTNGEHEKQKDWKNEIEKVRTGPQGGGTGPAGGTGYVLCVFAATIQGSWELPHDRFSEGSLYPVHTHTYIHTHTGHCRATQLLMQSTGNSHTPKIRLFFFLCCQIHSNACFTDLCIKWHMGLLLTLSRKDSQAWGSKNVYQPLNGVIL